MGGDSQIEVKVTRNEINRNGSWWWIRCLAGYFLRVGGIIYDPGRKIKICNTKIEFKGIVEAVIHFTVILLSRF